METVRGMITQRWLFETQLMHTMQSCGKKER